MLHVQSPFYNSILFYLSFHYGPRQNLNVIMKICEDRDIETNEEFKLELTLEWMKTARYLALKTVANTVNEGNMQFH